MHIFSADSFTLLPVEQMGTAYVAVGTLYAIGYANAIMAVAYQDNTIVIERFIYRVVYQNAPATQSNFLLDYTY